MPWQKSLFVRFVFIFVCIFLHKTTSIQKHSLLFVSPPLTYLLSQLQDERIGSTALVTRISRLLLPSTTPKVIIKAQNDTIGVFAYSSSNLSDLRTTPFASPVASPTSSVLSPAEAPLTPAEGDKSPALAAPSPQPSLKPPQDSVSLTVKPSIVATVIPSLFPTAAPSTTPSEQPLSAAPIETLAPFSSLAPIMSDQPQATPEPTSPTIIIPDKHDGGDTITDGSSDYFSFASPYMSFGLLLIGVLVMYGMYRFLFGRRSPSSTTGAAATAYSPVPQQEGGDIEMARSGNPRGPTAADEWEDDDWDQPAANNKATSNTSTRSNNNINIAPISASNSQHGRNNTNTSPPTFSTPNSNSLGNLSSGGRSTSRQNSNPNSQHGSYSTLPEPLPAIAPPPTSASKRSNRGVTPVEEDLFASIGISAVPKIKDPGLPDIDSIFSQRNAPSTSSRSNNNLGARGNSGKTSSKSGGGSVAKKLGGEDTDGNGGGRWGDDDKELDDLINS